MFYCFNRIKIVQMRLNNFDIKRSSESGSVRSRDSLIIEIIFVENDESKKLEEKQPFTLSLSFQIIVEINLHKKYINCFFIPM